jgi:hypothetical protein
VMNYSSVLIITYARSGSTLLQGVLNSIPGCLIRGENANFCFHLFNAYRSLMFARTRTTIMSDLNGTPQHPWFGCEQLDADGFLESCKVTIRQQLLADRITDPSVVCYGFKEVRYRMKEVRESLHEYLGFLARVFPSPAIVFNTRKPEDVASSAWLRNQDTEEQISDLRDLNVLFSETAAKHPDSFIISYEDVVNSTGRLPLLFEFLGAAYDQERTERLLSLQHSIKTDRSVQGW